jgi:oligopeptide transport system ATP-binding protein
MALLEVGGLAKHYPVRKGVIRAKVIGSVRAVDGVSFTLARGETLALVGESGCGKSTTARLVMRLIEASAGRVRFDGQDVTEADGAELRALRRRMQLVFQDPYASLNPRMTVGETIAEPMIVHGMGNAAARRDRVQDLLALVGLRPFHADRYPHEFSGGQRQRIGISPGAGGAAGSAGVRRTGQRAGRVRAGAGGQSAEGPADPVWPELSVHRT